MKMKKNYIYMFLSLFVIVLVTLMVQYPHFSFQLNNVSDKQNFSYALQSENCQLEHYYSSDEDYYGGADVHLDSDEKTLNAKVTLQDGTVIDHQLQKQSEGYYVMNVVKSKTQSQPKHIVIVDKDGNELVNDNLKVQVDELYQASNYDFSISNIYINNGGVFMGKFNAFDKEALLKDHTEVVVEVCHADDSKTSGYMLLARQQYPLDEFLKNETLGYLPFLHTASYDREKKVYIIITFTKDTQKSIVMPLVKGVS